MHDDIQVIQFTQPEEYFIANLKFALKLLFLCKIFRLKTKSLKFKFNQYNHSPRQKQPPLFSEYHAFAMCEICHKWISRYQLKRHQNTVHFKIKPYPCRFCSKCFGTAGNRTSHERSVHRPGG